MKNRLLATTLTLIMALSFTACNDEEDDDSSKAAGSKNTLPFAVTSVSEDVTTTSDEDVTTVSGNVTTAGGDVTTAGGDVTTAGGKVTTKPITTKKPAVTNELVSFQESVDWTRAPEDKDLLISYTYSGKSSNMYASFANLNVVCEPVGNYNLDAVVAEYVKLYNSTDGYTLTDSKKVTINGYDANQFTLRVTQQGISMTVIQYAIVKNNVGYYITFTAEDTSFDEIFPKFQEFANTFKIL